MLIKIRFETAMQKVASRRSNNGSSLSIEKMPSLSRIRISFVSSKSVLKIIALRPFVHRPALTRNLASKRKFNKVDFPLDCGPIIVTTKSLLPVICFYTQSMTAFNVVISIVSMSPSMISSAFPFSKVCDKTL